MGRRGYRLVPDPKCWTPMEAVALRWRTWAELIRESLAPAVVLARAYGGYQGA